MSPKPEFHLGQKVFWAEGGEVHRTFINDIKLEDDSLRRSVHLLMGGEEETSSPAEGEEQEPQYVYGTPDSAGPPFFTTFEAALKSAKKQLDKKVQKLKSQLAELQKHRRELATRGYRTRVLTAPVEQKKLMGMFGDGRVLSRIPSVPAGIFAVGEKVYVVITPETHNMMSGHWKPATYFVLETTVRGIYLRPDESVHYTLTTRYCPDTARLFREKEKAAWALQEVFQKETGATLPLKAVLFFSQNEEEVEEQKRWKRIVEEGLRTQAPG